MPVIEASEAENGLDLSNPVVLDEIEQRSEYRKQPIGYAIDKLGVKLHPKQQAVLGDLFKPNSRDLYEMP